MILVEVIAVGLAQLRANKLRSFLTLLGIMIGVAAVIARVALDVAFAIAAAAIGGACIGRIGHNISSCVFCGPTILLAGVGLGFAGVLAGVLLLAGVEATQTGVDLDVLLFCVGLGVLLVRFIG